MTSVEKVLVLGGTGRTGGRVLRQLLDRGVPVRALVRSAARLPGGVDGKLGLEVVEAEPLGLSADEWRALVEGCGAVISCLGHTTTVRGIFGPPRELVLPVLERVCTAIRALRPERPVKVVLMSTVSVIAHDARDARRGAFESAAVRALCALVPPAADNQAAADYLLKRVGTADAYVQWVVVRPDTLVEGEVGAYALHDGLVASLAKPDSTAMSNVAHFMCDLVFDEATWGRWRYRLPVIVDAAAA